MTALIGILNITPDSFSDGGEAATPQAALAKAKQLLSAGAKGLDVGAESTRPGATPLSPQEEWARLSPVLPGLAALCKTYGAILSVDTRHAFVARHALEVGADWINDVAGFADPDMVKAVVDHHCKLVVMHSLSVPADPSHVLPEEGDVVSAVLQALDRRINVLVRAGIARERLILDPGIGFGKTAEQSRELLRRIDEFHVLNCPLLAGHSRKSFLGGDVPSREAATLDWSERLKEKRVAYLRVHDVAVHKAAGL